MVQEKAVRERTEVRIRGLLKACAIAVCLTLPYAAYMVIFSAWDRHSVLVAIATPVLLAAIAYLALWATPGGRGDE